MSEKELDLGALKKIGIIQQKQKDKFVIRLRVVGGDLKAAQIRTIAEVAEKYGEGYIHLSTRQGAEIHGVHFTNLDKARQELENGSIQMGASGPLVRIIVACPGAATCRWGIIETKSIAKELDEKYFREETPHKFKIGITGCPNNCAKATENDIGIMGAILPHGGGAGFNLTIGGTMGKAPRLGTILKKQIADKVELYQLIERSLRYYQKNGNKKERFGHMIDRLGVDKVIKEILENGG